MPQISSVYIQLPFLFHYQKGIPKLVQKLMLKKPKGAGYNNVGTPIAEQLAPRL